MEGKTDCVAGGDEVGSGVDVSGHVVIGLSAEKREESAEGGGRIRGGYFR